jgi:hypothetical protein
MSGQNNQAGPSSVPPETQPGLQETIQPGEKIIEGARNEDQLDKLKPGTEEGNEKELPREGQ